MADLWLPGYTRVDLGWRGGPYDDVARPKLCWHTTEGATLGGAERAFRSYPPHLGVHPATGQKHQYVPLNKHAYALAGSESDDEYVIQVEVVGFAAQSHTWPVEWLRWLAEHVVRPIRDAVGVPNVVVPAGFRTAGEGIVLATPTSPIRLSAAQLRAFAGHLGHQHIPTPDSHWDPGGLPIDAIVTYSMEDDMQLTELVDFRVQHPDGAYRSLYDSTWQTRADLLAIAAEQAKQTALLTTLVGRDPAVPLDAAAITAALNANLDAELAKLADQLRADAAAAREADRAALLELARTELGDAAVDELAARLAT